jgi:hypothetical protein
MASNEIVGKSSAEGFRPRKTGLVLFAVILLIVAGALHALQGLAALTNGNFYAVVDNYAYDLDIEVWGWSHLIMGMVLLATGIGLYRGSQFAWLMATFIIVVMTIVNFILIPLHPAWAITMIVLNGLILLALLSEPD